MLSEISVKFSVLSPFQGFFQGYAYLWLAFSVIGIHTRRLGPFKLLLGSLDCDRYSG